MLKINNEEIALFSYYIKELTGIALDESKAYLLETRLGPVIQELKCSTYLELYNKSINDHEKIIQNRIIDAISTNETSFFRDEFVFALLKNKILPEHVTRINNGNGGFRKALRIWSAGSATGQEAYSIAMVVNEVVPDIANWNIQILGTDISGSSIRKAQEGCYNEIEIKRGLSEEIIEKYFYKKSDVWCINDDIKSLVGFEKGDLNEFGSHYGTFDIIFCRNVAIYFSPDSRAKLFNNIAEKLKLEGYLIIGSTESLLGITDKYLQKRAENSSYYVLK